MASTPPVDVLLEVLGLKALPRTGWGRRGVDPAESVAGHSWGVAWLVLALVPPELDRARALSYAVLHDLAEVRVGDLTPDDGVEARDKAAREARAMHALTERWDRGAELHATWHAYEAQQDPEARFVRQLDRLDMALQAVVYHQAGHDGMAEFIESAAAVIEHPTLVPLLDACRDRVR